MKLRRATNCSVTKRFLRSADGAWTWDQGTRAAVGGAKAPSFAAFRLAQRRVGPGRSQSTNPRSSDVTITQMSDAQAEDDEADAHLARVAEDERDDEEGDGDQTPTRR